MMSWRSVTRLLTVVVTGACRASEPGGVVLDISADPQSVQLPQPVSITLRAVNNSSRTITAYAPGFYGFCYHAFRVFDAQDREVAVPSGLCAAFNPLPALIDLPPGESITIIDSWDTSASTLDGQVLAPGIYRLVGRYVADEREITSSALAITLRP